MPKKYSFEDIQVRVVPNAGTWAGIDHSAMEPARMCVDDLYAFIRKVDDECADAEDSGEFSPEGIARRRGKIGERALTELRKLQSFGKADKSLRECVEHIGTKMTDPPKPVDTHSAMLASEIRAFVRSQSSPATYAMSNIGDAALVGAILNAPSFLTGLKEQDVETVRAASRVKLHPELAKMQDTLRGVHAEMTEGVAAAERMVTARTGMRMDEDGVVRKVDAPKPLTIVQKAA